MADSGLASLDVMIARLRTLGGGDVAQRVAVRAAPLVDAELKRTAAAGTTPDGKAWKPKKDGGRPLVNAAAAIATRSAGNYVLALLKGPTVYHHLGLGGKPHRQVLPQSGTIPSGIAKVLERAARAVLREILEGGR